MDVHGRRSSNCSGGYHPSAATHQVTTLRSFQPEESRAAESPAKVLSVALLSFAVKSGFSPGQLTCITQAAWWRASLWAMNSQNIFKHCVSKWLVVHSITESQNKLSWRRLTRTIESYSWPCTEPSQKSHHVPQEYCPNASIAPTRNKELNLGTGHCSLWPWLSLIAFPMKEVAEKRIKTPSHSG